MAFTLEALDARVATRAAASPEESYTAKLLARGVEKCAQKLGEEAVEAAIAAAGVGVGEILEIGSREAIREAVAAGLGIGIVAQSEFGDDVRLKAIELAGERIKSIEYVACLNDRRTTPLVKAFLDIVRDGLAENKHSR